MTEWWSLNAGKAETKPVAIEGKCVVQGDVISYKGDNFYRSCGYIVTGTPLLGSTSCLKRIGHPGNVHEDYAGLTRKEAMD